MRTCDEACEMLLSKHCNLYDVAEYLLLGEASAAGKQDAEWEKKWATLNKKSTGYVNHIYKYGYEYVMTSAGVIQFITEKGL